MGNELASSPSNLKHQIKFIKSITSKPEALPSISDLGYSIDLEQVMETDNVQLIKTAIADLIIKTAWNFSNSIVDLSVRISDHIQIGYLKKGEANADKGILIFDSTGTFSEYVFFTETLQIGNHKRNILFFENLFGEAIYSKFSYNREIEKVYYLHRQSIYDIISKEVSLTLDKSIDILMMKEFSKNIYFAFLSSVFGIGFQRNIISLGKLVRFEKGEIIQPESRIRNLTEGVKPNKFYFVLSGVLTLSKRFKKLEKREIDVFSAKKGEILYVITQIKSAL